MSMERYEQSAEMALTDAQDVAIQRLSEWAQAASAAHNIAGTLVQTSFCPESFRNKPGEATAAILAGLEIGLQPMAALRSFDVIQGQAAPRAVTLRAVVQSHGHEIEIVESTATRCRMRGRRRGSQNWQTVDWTIDRAKQLGVTSKSNWKSQPQSMLVARATGEIARLIASDAILGIAYSVEEIADGGVAEMQAAAETAGEVRPIGTRKMSRRQQVSDPDPEPEVVEESPYLNTSSSLAKHMFGAMNDLGVTEREDRLDFVNDVLGFDEADPNRITTSIEMTDADAERVIAYAEERKAAIAGAES